MFWKYQRPKTSASWSVLDFGFESELASPSGLDSDSDAAALVIKDPDFEKNPDWFPWILSKWSLLKPESWICEVDLEERPNG